MNRLVSHCHGVNAGVPSVTAAAAVSDEFFPPPTVPGFDCDVHVVAGVTSKRSSQRIY